MSFDAFLDELEELQKGMAPGDDMRADRKIKQMAGDHDEPDEDDEEDYEGPGDDDEDNQDDDDEDEMPMGKSFLFALDDGTQVEAQDGTELVKSLMERVDVTDYQMQKGFTALADLVKSQAHTIAQMQADIKRLGAEGRGRKSTVSIAERPSPLVKSEAPAAGDVLAKAMAAFDQGRINGRDLTVLDASLRMGQPVDPAILAKIEPHN